MLENLQGIGPKTINMLNMMGIYNVLDLLCYYPCRYDILKRSDISNLSSRDRVVTSGVIDGQPTMIFITEEFRKIIFRVNTGRGILNITVYNRNSLYKDLAQGKVVTVIGVYDRSKNTVIASSVRFEELPVSPKIDSVYRLYNVMSKRAFEKIVKSGLDWMMSDSQGDTDRDLARALQGSLPDFIIDRYNFLSIRKAIAEVHNPSDITMLKRARKRLKYEEMFNYLLRNRYLAKRIRESKRCIKRRDFSKDVYGFIEKEGIVLSPSQRGCIGEILGDFNRTGRMYRMVMGDRFSGKFLCGMMGCYFNFLAGHKGVILAESDGDCEYVMRRIGEIGEKMGMRIGVKKEMELGSNKKVGNGEVEGIGKIGENGVNIIGTDMGNDDGGSKSEFGYDLLGELREDVSGSCSHSVKAQNGGLIGEAIYNKERKMENGDAEVAREGATEADFWGDFDVIICNRHLLGAEMGKSDVGFCVVYNGARGLVDFGALRIFMDSKADILCISDVAISEKRDGLLYEGLDVSRVSAGTGMRPVSVDVRVCKGKDREIVLSDMEACLESGFGVVVVQSQKGDSGNGAGDGVGDGEDVAGVLRGVSSGEMGEPDRGFGEVVQEWFEARAEDRGRNMDEGMKSAGVDKSIGENMGENINRNMDKNIGENINRNKDKDLDMSKDLNKNKDVNMDRNMDGDSDWDSYLGSDRGIVEIGNESDKGVVLRKIEEFSRGKARILLISSEEFDWLDSRGMVGDVICNGKVKMVVIDGGEEYSLARLHGYRCMMAGDDGLKEGDGNRDGYENIGTEDEEKIRENVMGEKIINNGVINKINKEVISEEIKKEMKEIKKIKNEKNVQSLEKNLKEKIETEKLKIEIKNADNKESNLNEENEMNNLNKTSGEKKSMIFDIILNDNDKDLKFFEDVTNGFVISDYDFMYKGNEKFDWFRRGDGGMVICNVKRDFNMMERVKDDVDKYFELFLDNSAWSEKVLRG